MRMKGVLAVALMIVASPVWASDMSSDEQWACEVAMCMSNPGGMTEFAECKAPIRKMLREQAKGNVIPKCKFLAGGGDDGSGGGGGPRGPNNPETPIQVR